MIFLIICTILLSAAEVTRGEPKNLIRISLSRSIEPSGGPYGQPLTNYYFKASVGTPPKPFNFLVDINARENWLPHHLKLGEIYPRLNYKNGYAKKTSSSGIKEDEKQYNVDYESCELTGKAYRDLFEFRDVVESLKLPRFTQRFLAISSASNGNFSPRKSAGIDGVMGLNPWPISEIGSDMMIVALSRAGLIGELKFGLALQDSTSLSEKPENGGELTLGGINPTYYLGTLRFHQVQSQYNWELMLQSVMLGASPVSCTSGSSQGVCTALISTSHNDIQGPKQDVKQILSVLGFKTLIEDEGVRPGKLYDIDCLKVASSPTLTFVIEGLYYVVPPTAYIRKKTEGIIFKSETCYIAIHANDKSDGQWILGTNFLVNFYSIFDINARKIAFGVRK